MRPPPRSKSLRLPTPVPSATQHPCFSTSCPGQGRPGDGHTDNCVKRREGEAKDGGGAKCGTGKSRTETPRWKGALGTVLTTGPLGKATWPAQWGSTVVRQLSLQHECALRHADLAVFHIGHCWSPTCCHTLPRRILETQAHQLLPCSTRCGNMATSLCHAEWQLRAVRREPSFANADWLRNDPTHPWDPSHCSAIFKTEKKKGRRKRKKKREKK